MNASHYGVKLFVLDANILVHDPMALLRFQEHSVFLPGAVLDELDETKQQSAELARNARQASRLLDSLLENKTVNDIDVGLVLPHSIDGPCAGRLFFQARLDETTQSPGESILETALRVQREQPDTRVILVSKNVNTRVKAQVLGLDAQDYLNDVVLDDVSLLHTGVSVVEPAIQHDDLKTLEHSQVADRWLYPLPSAQRSSWAPGLCLYDGTDHDAGVIVRHIVDAGAVVSLAKNYRDQGDAVWGVHARNAEQNFALNLLLDPDYEFVSLLGTAGTGKTLLALAAGLAQTFEEKRYREIIMTRVTISVGEEIGYLPGTEEEKMTPWMGALMDNLEVLGERTTGGQWDRAASQDLLRNRVKIRSVNFMRGRTFLNRYIIVDEAQNLTRKQMKTLVTRAGPGTKFVCIGNIAQIDTPYVSEITSGLTYAVERFKSWPHSAHITLRRGERSRLADFASDAL